MPVSLFLKQISVPTLTVLTPVPRYETDLEIAHMTDPGLVEPMPVFDPRRKTCWVVCCFRSDVRRGLLSGSWVSVT